MVEAPAALSPPAAQIGVVLRGEGASLRELLEARPAARLEGRRSLALGRLHPGRRGADAGGAPSRRKEPAGRSAQARRCIARAQADEAGETALNAAREAARQAAMMESEARDGAAPRARASGGGARAPRRRRAPLRADRPAPFGAGGGQGANPRQSRRGGAEARQPRRGAGRARRAGFSRRRAGEPARQAP